MEEVEDANFLEELSLAKKSSRVFDIILILIAIAVAILIRLPSLFLTGVASEERSEYISETGEPFLKEMDSYHFLKKMNIILGKDNNRLQTFDNGLPIFTAFIFWIFNIFSQVSLEQIAGVIGPILFSLSCIPAYIFVKRKTNRVGGFISALLIGIMPALVVANEFLIFDTDILTTVLPLFIALCFVLAIEAKERRKRILFAILSVLLSVALGLSWHSSSVYFYLFFAVSGAILIYLLIQERFKFRKFFLRAETKITVSLLLSFLLVFGLLFSFGFLKGNLKIFGVKEESFYPESGMFVQELSDLPFIEGKNITDYFSVLKNGSVNILGGIGLFLLACISAGFLTLVIFANRGKTCGKLSKKFVQYKELAIIGILLVVWFLGTILSLSFGLRFTKVATMPVCLLAGIFIGILFEKRKGIKATVGFVLVVLLAVFPSFSAVKASFVSKPSVDKALEETANYIREELGEDYVVVSWWDTGHYFEYKGLDVLFDGGTASGGEMFWVGTAFATENPKLARGIFRMLSEDNLELIAPKKASEIVGDYAEGVEILMKILPLEREQAEKELVEGYNFSKEDAGELLELSHPQGAKKFAVVVFDGMVSNSNAIFYYGNYNLKTRESEYRPEEVEKVNNSMLFRFYNEEEEFFRFKFKKKITDEIGKYGARIWVEE